MKELELEGQSIAICSNYLSDIKQIAAYQLIIPFFLIVLIGIIFFKYIYHRGK